MNNLKLSDLQKGDFLAIKTSSTIVRGYLVLESGKERTKQFRDFSKKLKIPQGEIYFVNTTGFSISSLDYESSLEDKNGKPILYIVKNYTKSAEEDFVEGRVVFDEEDLYYRDNFTNQTVKTNSRVEKELVTKSMRRGVKWLM